MPRPSDDAITVRKDIHRRWKQLAIALGYGERGKQKLLEYMIEHAEGHTELFQKRN